MRALIVGAVESTRIALHTASSCGWSVAGLITLPPECAARHSDFTDLAQEAEALGAGVVFARNSNAPEVLDYVRDLKADLVMVIGWSQICSRAFIDAAGGRVLGYHPAPLPRLRGRGIIPWTILQREPITAGTLFWIDDGVDSGPIVAQRFMHVAADETAASLYARHLDLLERLLEDALAGFAAGRADGTKQDERFATWAAKRRPEDGLISWHDSRDRIWTLIRAVGRPYPGAFTSYRGKPLTIWQADLWDGGGRHVGAPGQIVARTDRGFVVNCGDGREIEIVEWESGEGVVPALHARLGSTSLAA